MPSSCPDQRAGARADSAPRRPLQSRHLGVTPRRQPPAGTPRRPAHRCGSACRRRWLRRAGPPTIGTARPSRANVLPPMRPRSRKPIALLSTMSAGAGRRLKAMPGELAPCRHEAGLLEQVVAVGADEREEHGRTDVGLLEVVAAHLGGRRRHAGAEQVELEHVGRQRDRHREEATEARHETADRAELPVVAPDDLDRLLDVAASVLERPLGDRVGRVEGSTAVDADVEQSLDEPGRGAREPALVGQLGALERPAVARPARTCLAVSSRRLGRLVAVDIPGVPRACPSLGVKSRSS